MIPLSPFLFAAVTLAAYRTWRLVAIDDVPFGSLRRRLLRRWGAQASDAPDPRSAERYMEGFQCPWCLGSLITFAFWIGVAAIVSVPLPALVALASSAIVGLLSRLDDV